MADESGDHPEGHDPEKSVMKSLDVSQFDLFAKPFPTFNSKGLDKASSRVGMLLSLVVVILVGLFSI